jgi:hypothetical protein
MARRSPMKKRGMLQVCEHFEAGCNAVSETKMSYSNRF